MSAWVTVSARAYYLASRSHPLAMTFTTMTPWRSRYAAAKLARSSKPDDRPGAVRRGETRSVDSNPVEESTGAGHEDSPVSPDAPVPMDARQRTSAAPSRRCSIPAPDGDWGEW